MPLISIFDGLNKRITLDIANVIPVQGVPTMVVDVVALYREIVDWRNTNTAGDPNSRWLQPVRASGGDRRDSTTLDGTRIFFMNDWEIIPADTSHTLIMEGAVGVDFTTNTSGKFIDFSTLSAGSLVSVTYQQPDLISTVEISSGGSGGGGDATEANQINILSNLLAMQGTGFNTSLHSLVQIINAIASLPPPSDATEANQASIASAIATVQDVLDLLGYTPGNPVTVVDNAAGTDTITTSDNKRVQVTTTGTTTTITRNDP